jgi:2'-5' RNA ligase
MQYFIGVSVRGKAGAAVNETRRYLKSIEVKTPSTAPHITIVPPFNLDNDHKDVLIEVLEGHSGFDLFNLDIGFPKVWKPSTLILPVVQSEPLTDLFQTTQTSVSAFGISLAKRFNPHVTIAKGLTQDQMSDFWDWCRTAAGQSTLFEKGMSTRVGDVTLYERESKYHEWSGQAVSAIPF